VKALALCIIPVNLAELRSVYDKENQGVITNPILRPSISYSNDLRGGYEIVLHPFRASGEVYVILGSLDVNRPEVPLQISTQVSVDSKGVKIKDGAHFQDNVFGARIMHHASRNEIDIIHPG